MHFIQIQHKENRLNNMSNKPLMLSAYEESLKKRHDTKKSNRSVTSKTIGLQSRTVVNSLVCALEEVVS